MVDDWDFRGKRILTRVNGEAVQDGNTDEMIWDMHYLVADIARTITLVPGDVILSGTPANSRPVQPGDVVEVEVEGLGCLTNRIVEGVDAHPRGRRRPAQRVRGGRLDGVRRRLGVPRDPPARARLTVDAARATEAWQTLRDTCIRSDRGAAVGSRSPARVGLRCGH